MIRIIALLTMLLDHIVQVYFPNIEKFNFIGRLAFPLFAWGIVKGFIRTTNYKKYALRLFILAIISQIPYFLLFKWNYLNVCFTMLAGLLALKIYNSKLSIWIKWSVLFALLALAHVFNFEYGIYGIVTILIFYIAKSKSYIMFLQLVVTIISINIYSTYPIQIFSVLSCYLISNFEEYDFKINRLLQYGFYPIHLIVIWLFTFIIPIN
jgi:hypothetical protein